MNFFGGDQRKAFVQIKTHLVAKHAGGAGAGAVGFEHAMVVHMAHEIFVLRANGACGHGLIKRGCSMALDAIWAEA
jgi:hypothetical protein